MARETRAPESYNALIVFSLTHSYTHTHTGLPFNELSLVSSVEHCGGQADERPLNDLVLMLVWPHALAFCLLVTHTHTRTHAQTHTCIQTTLVLQGIWLARTQLAFTPLQWVYCCFRQFNLPSISARSHHPTLSLSPSLPLTTSFSPPLPSPPPQCCSAACWREKKKENTPTTSSHKRTSPFYTHTSTHTEAPGNAYGFSPLHFHAHAHSSMPL